MNEQAGAGEAGKENLTPCRLSIAMEWGRSDLPTASFRVVVGVNGVSDIAALVDAVHLRATEAERADGLPRIRAVIAGTV